MSKYHDFRNREICFFDSQKIRHPIRGYKADYEWQIDSIANNEKDLRNHQYNTYCSICQYDPMPTFSNTNMKKHWNEFKHWVEIRDLTIKSIDFFIDFDGTSLKNTFDETILAHKFLLDIIGSQALYLNTYFSGNKGFHILGKMGSSFGTTPSEKLKKNYEIAIMLKPLCPTIDETIYDLARVRKLIGSKVYSPTLGQTRVIDCNDLKEFQKLMELIENKNWSEWEQQPIRRLNKIEIMKESDLL